MSFRSSPQKFHAQPQEVVRPAAQYAEHMGALLLPSAGIIDLADGGKWTTWGTAPAINSGVHGVCVDTTAAFGGLQLLPKANQATTAQTHIALIETTAVSGNFAGMFACADSGGGNVSLAVQRDSGGKWSTWTTNALDSKWITTSAALGWAVVIVTGDTSGTQTYLNGAQEQATTNAPSSQSTSRLVIFGERSGSTTYATKGRIALYSHLTRKLSAAEVSHLSVSPWALIEPHRIWVPVTSSATAPTLLTATAIDIGTTSLRPRVTFSR